jgi:hypothetical protein
MYKPDRIKALKTWIERGEKTIKEGVFYKEAHRETTVVDVQFWKRELAKLESKES